MNHILIYTDINTDRLQYIFSFFFRERFLNCYRLCTDRNEFSAYSGPKFSYCNEPLSNELHIHPHPVLQQQGIQRQVFDMEFFHSLFRDTSFRPRRFSSAQDPFALSFYLLTRYEEYLPFSADRYGRFEAIESLLYKSKLLGVPVLDIWKSLLEETFRKDGSVLNSNDNYRFINTIDIDQAYAFKYKSLVRTLGGFSKSLISGRFKEMSKRFSVQLGISSDPFDCYERMEAMQEHFGYEQIYFFLIGDRGKYDRNISYHSPALSKLVRKLGEHSRIGIHPSFGSDGREEIIKKEKERLEAITDYPIIRSRQHFLKIRFPQTYLSLLALGIKEDYSMGFASRPGFRAGTCHPFYWYDLSRESMTNLLVFPVTLMEGSFLEDMEMTAENTLQEIERYLRICKQNNGCFIPIFHNESISGYARCKGWDRVYENMIKLAIQYRNY